MGLFIGFLIGFVILAAAIIFVPPGFLVVGVICAVGAFVAVAAFGKSS